MNAANVVTFIWRNVTFSRPSDIGVLVECNYYIHIGTRDRDIFIGPSDIHCVEWTFTLGQVVVILWNATIALGPVIFCGLCSCNINITLRDEVVSEQI